MQSARQHPHRQKETGPAGDSARPVQAAAAGYQAVDMRTALEVSGPCRARRQSRSRRRDGAGVGGDRGSASRPPPLNRDRRRRFPCSGRRFRPPPWESVNTTWKYGTVLPGASHVHVLAPPWHFGYGPGEGRADAARIVGRCGRGRIRCSAPTAASPPARADVDRSHDVPLERGRGGRHCAWRIGFAMAVEDVRHLQSRRWTAAGQAGSASPPALEPVERADGCCRIVVAATCV